MSGVIRTLLGAFWKLTQAPASIAPEVPLTPERIDERLARRPSGNEPRRAALIAQPTPVPAVVEEPAEPWPELEAAAADAPNEIEQQCGEEPRLANDSHVDLNAKAPVDPAVDMPAGSLEPVSLAPEGISWAHEANDPQSVEKQQPIRQALEARPPTKIPAEWNALMQQHFDRAQPKPEVLDVLKILGLDEGELNSTPPTVPDLVLETPPEARPIALPEPAAAVETPGAQTPAPEEPTGKVAELEAEKLVAEAPHESAITVEPADVAGKIQPLSETSALPRWRKRTVGEVILEGECSVRLANCIAANQDFFADWTIGEALDHRSEFTAVLMNVRSLGRKTASEALDALDAYAADPEHELKEPGESEGAVVADPLFGLVPAKLNAPLSEVLRGQSVSMRLGNVAASGQLDGLTMRDFVLDPDAVRARLLGCKNAGRKTAEEAIEHLAAQVEHLGQLDLEHVAPTRTDNPASERISTGEWVRREVASLPPKHIEVLNSRYGLEGGTPQTLQEIAERVYVTRERVRQVEAKALNRLRAEPRSRMAFTRYLSEEKDAQWAILFGPQFSIAKSEVQERTRKLSTWFRLAIDIVFKDGVDAYLEANAHRTPNGWFRSSDDAEDRQKLDHLLGDILGANRTPMPLNTLEELAPTAMASVSGEGDHWRVLDGYIFTGYVGSKARRTARMHGIARRIAQLGIFDIGTLIAEYRAAFPEDDCGSRMFEMQGNEAPHLFAPLFDGIWLCLDHGTRPVNCLPSPPFCRQGVEETQFAEGSVGWQLLEKLTRFGPQRMIDLRRDIVDNGQGPLSMSSVGVVLISNPCFRRVAPGVFGLYTNALEASADLDAHLLEDRHCRSYCHARHSGAPQDYYPMWGAGYEMRLATWARHHAPPDLYRSLMAVIEPASWPASPDTIAEFQGLQRRDGRWQIGSSRRHGLGHRFLDSAQFFAVLTHLVTFGWIGWFAVNRVTGTINSNHHAADVLAFLVMTGLVEPEPDWQAPHRPTDLATRLFLEARWERHLHGNTSSGDEDVFGRLKSALYDAPPTSSRGWVDVEEFTAAMPAWRSEGISIGRAFGGAQARQPGLNAEGSFESDDWGAVFAA